MRKIADRSNQVKAHEKLLEMKRYAKEVAVGCDNEVALDLSYIDQLDIDHEDEYVPLPYERYGASEVRWKF